MQSMIIQYLTNVYLTVAKVNMITSKMSTPWKRYVVTKESTKWK